MELTQLDAANISKMSCNTDVVKQLQNLKKMKKNFKSPKPLFENFRAKCHNDIINELQNVCEVVSVVTDNEGNQIACDMMAQHELERPHQQV